MKRLFKLNVYSYEESNSLLMHLISVAKAWSEGRNQIELNSLEDFHQALNRERDWFCKDNEQAQPDDVAIHTYEYDGRTQVRIVSTHFLQFYEAWIERLSNEERDQLEVQEGLLIPVRS